MAMVVHSGGHRCKNSRLDSSHSTWPKQLQAAVVFVTRASGTFKWQRASVLDMSVEVLRPRLDSIWELSIGVSPYWSTCTVDTPDSTAQQSGHCSVRHSNAP